MATTSLKILTYALKDPIAREYYESALHDFFEQAAMELECESYPDLMETIGRDSADLVMPMFYEYFFANDFYDEEGDVWNVIDVYLKKKGMLLKPEEREYLRQLRTTYHSVYEVLKVVPNESITVHDILDPDAKPIVVKEKLGTQGIVQWDVLAARVMTVKGKTQFSGALLPLDRSYVPEMIEEIHNLDDLMQGMVEPGSEAMQEIVKQLAKEAGAELPENDDIWKDIAEFKQELDAQMQNLTEAEQQHAQKLLWAGTMVAYWLRDQLESSQPKKPYNTDGHPLEFVTLTYPLLAEYRQVGDMLFAQEDIICAENTKTKSFWNWVKLPAKGKKKKADKIVSLPKNGVMILSQFNDPDYPEPLNMRGTIELFTKGKLVAQANSEERAAVMEKHMAKLLKGMLGQPTRKIEKMEFPSTASASAKRQQPKIPGISAKEMAQMMREYLDKHYHDWLDSPLPGLGNKTPRQRAKTKQGKAEVLNLIKKMQVNEARRAKQSGESAYDFSWMWQELGLVALEAA